MAYVTAMYCLGTVHAQLSLRAEFEGFVYDARGPVAYFSDYAQKAGNIKVTCFLLSVGSSSWPRSC